MVKKSSQYETAASSETLYDLITAIYTNWPLLKLKNIVRQEFNKIKINANSRLKTAVDIYYKIVFMKLVLQVQNNVNYKTWNRFVL